jgi:hypothetical protein
VGEPLQDKPGISLLPARQAMTLRLACESFDVVWGHLPSRLCPRLEAIAILNVAPIRRGNVYTGIHS